MSEQISGNQAGEGGRMSITNEEIKDRVTYHAPSPSGVERHAALSKAAEAFIACIRDVCPPGREQALAFTNAEQAKMWASAGVARNPETV